MLSKTTRLETKIKEDIQQVKLVGALQPKGSFDKTKNWVSDIDYTALVRFEPFLIEHIKNRIPAAKDFIFVKFTVGYDDRYKAPWTINIEGIQSMYVHYALNIYNYNLKETKSLIKTLIYTNTLSTKDKQILKDLGRSERNLPEIHQILKKYLIACDFDLKLTMEWFKNFKNKKLMSTEELDEIEKILNKDKLILGDLIDIENILESKGTLRWTWEETIRGIKIVRDKSGKIIKSYNMLEELKKSNGPVIQLIYKYDYPKKLVSVDLGLTDKKYTKIFNAPPFYYKYNWYKILKTYKYAYNIKKENKDAYWKIMNQLELENALISKIKLIRSIIKYKVKVHKKKKDNIQIIKYHINIVIKELKKIGITVDTSNPKKITKNFAIAEKQLKKRLSEKSRELVYKLLPLLQDKSRLAKHLQIYKTEMTQEGVPRDVLITRKMRGIKCPFFKETFGEYLDYISYNTILNKDLVNKCFTTIYKDLSLDMENILIKFKNIPANRLFLERGTNTEEEEGKITEEKVIIVKGVFTPKDISFFNNLNIGFGRTHIFDKEYTHIIPQNSLKRVQIYMLLGK